LTLAVFFLLDAADVRGPPFGCKPNECAEIAQDPDLGLKKGSKDERRQKVKKISRNLTNLSANGGPLVDSSGSQHCKLCERPEKIWSARDDLNLDPCARGSLQFPRHYYVVMSAGHDSLLYARVETVLGGEITDGDLKIGDQLPTEDNLIARFGVSRITVRRAIQNLVSRGLVEIRRGKGTFAATPKITHDLKELRGFVEDICTHLAASQRPRNQ
jgi:DNA-binding transcriptional regulator YhcF (GntR family)